MKKKLALFLAAAMTVSALPMTAFASTTNTVSRVASVENNKNFQSTIVLDDFKGVTSTTGEQTFKITLTNAKWGTDSKENNVMFEPDGTTKVPGVTYEGTQDKITASKEVKITRLSDTQAMVAFTVQADRQDDAKLELPLKLESDGEGDATATIDDVDSVVSAQTLKIANVQGGATTTTISGTTSIKETPTQIKAILVTETTAGTIKTGKGTSQQIKLKAPNGFNWDNGKGHTPKPVAYPTGKIQVAFDHIDDNEMYFNVTGDASTTATTISFDNLWVSYDDDDVNVGDECNVTVSGADMTKETILVGTASDYDVNFTAEDKELPVFYSGRYDDDTDSLVVKVKEAVAGSWLNDRKAKIVFPEGVEVMSVEDDKTVKGGSYTYSIDENEVTINGTKDTSSTKFELNLKFQLSVAPDFTGDITATLTGSAVGEDQTVTVGTAKFPVTVDADANELKIDYKNTAASDITLTEAEAGVLEKGKTVALALDNIDFDGTPTVEVTSGDLKIKNVKTNKGVLSFVVDSESSKEAATIKISDIQLYMERSLPAGSYDLKVTSTDHDKLYKAADKTNPVKDTISNESTNAIIQNYSETNEDATGYFDVDDVTVKKGYVQVVTAGRDQDDSTFTTQVSVTIGADKMYAGTKEIALDVPAYIANGYTMLPVRAVTEALSGAAIVRWDDASKTVTITFGQRVINMTVGSKTMVINGVNVAMQAACEITDNRAFIPLRDLGYALGLNDSKIAWDDATKTATLN